MESRNAVFIDLQCNSIKETENQLTIDIKRLCLLNVQIDWIILNICWWRIFFSFYGNLICFCHLPAIFYDAFFALDLSSFCVFFLANKLKMCKEEWSRKGIVDGTGRNVSCFKCVSKSSNCDSFDENIRFVIIEWCALSFGCSSAINIRLLKRVRKVSWTAWQIFD